LDSLLYIAITSNTSIGLPPMTNLIDGVSRIEIPTPFPVGSVNCYLIEGSPLTLIDTGPKTPKSLAVMQKELQARSYSFSDIEQILLTHGHIDHIGLAAQFVRERATTNGNPTKVWIHQKDATAVVNYDRYAELYQEFYMGLITTSGVPKNELPMRSLTRLIEYFKSLVESVPTALSFKDNASFKTGIGELSTVWVPGHSSGSTCYVCDEQRILFSGDFILRDISSNPSISFDKSEKIGMITYLESLNHISSRDSYIALPGHREPITDIKSRIEVLRAEYEDKLQKAADSLTSNPQTAYELSRIIYGDYDTNSLILALAESHDLLRILESRNQAKLVNQNGVIQAFKNND
jgi:glyoxylase-like metal-dependent hydrolase (beta-lactamase superfamily II)